VSEITWRMDVGDAAALATFLDDALDNLYFDQGDELEERLMRWKSELEGVLSQRARYDALLQPVLTGLA